jgi:phosphoglycolate phosphatase-like HAD superfamily hydrolase
MEFLSLHSLAPLFDSIVTMDDAPLKPSPEPIHLAMRQAAGARAIMFGDTKVQAALELRSQRAITRSIVCFRTTS